MMFNRFISIALILTLFEPVSEYALKQSLKPKANDEHTKDEIIYDPITRTEHLQNQFEYGECPRKSSTRRNLLAEAGDAAAQIVQDYAIPHKFLQMIGETPFKRPEHDKYIDQLRETETETIAYAKRIYNDRISVIQNDGISPYGRKRKVVVIGDPHGSGQQMVEILQKERLINNAFQWIGVNTIVVIMGDLIHRGAYSAWLVYMVFYEWQPVAPNYGSNVMCLLGNHELQQFWYGYQLIALSKMGYKPGTVFHLPEDQIVFLQNEAILDNINHNSFIIVKINKHVFTHSGFSWSAMEEFCIHNGIPPEQQRGDNLIDSVNLHSRLLISLYSNDKLNEITKKRQGSFDKCKVDYVMSVTLKFWCLKKVLQDEAAANEAKGPGLGQEVQRIIDDMKAIEITLKLVSSQTLTLLECTKATGIETHLKQLKDETLRQFKSQTLWVGHFYGQMLGIKVRWKRQLQVVFEDSNSNMIFTDLGMFSKDTTIAYFEIGTDDIVLLWQTKEDGDWIPYYDLSAVNVV